MNDCDDTPSPAGAAIPCPVVMLAERLGRVRARTVELDGMQASTRGDPFPKNYLKKAEQHSFDEENTLRDMITSTEAQSLEGVLVQITEAMARMDILFDLIPHGDQDGDALRDRRAAERLMFSILREVSAHCSRSIDTILVGEFASWNLDPWRPVEERIAEVEAKQGDRRKARAS